MEEARKIQVMGRDILLDRNRLIFSEATLSEYLETEAGFYDYYGAVLADAEREMADRELNWEVVYSERFKENKENGCTEKLAESNAKADPDVIIARKEFLDAKYTVKLIQQHLRSWDKNHENAQSRGHTLRKEMDRLNRDIRTPDMERRLEEVFKE